MSQGVGNSSGSSFSVASLLRSVGRIALWVALGLVLFRGFAALAAPPRADAPVIEAEAAPFGQAAAAVAVRFVRAYLTDPSPRALAPFLTVGARVSGGRAPVALGSGVAQAEVAATRKLGDGRAVLTVACELRDSRTLYLAVPISRSRAGEVAVLGAPSIVAAPSVAGVAPERPQPIAGPDADSIQALVEKFIPAYVTARSVGDLSYLLAPGATIVPLAGALELSGAPGVATQLGDGEGQRRTVLVPCWLRDPAGGALYRLSYRLVVVRRDRWYVAAVEGELK